MRLLQAGFAFILAGACCGCGDSGVTEGEFKKTDTSQFDQMKNDMIKNLKQGSRRVPGSAPGKTK
jgi:hypothetical protein